MQSSTAHSDKVSDGLVCGTSSSLHVILAPRLQVSKSPGAGVPEGQSLYLFKLVPKILI